MYIMYLPGVPEIQWFSSQQQQDKSRPLLQFFWQANVEELWSSQAYLRHQQQTTSIQIWPRQDLSEPVLSSSLSRTCHYRQPTASGPLLCELFISMWTSMVHGYWFGECNLGLFCYVVFLLAQLFTVPVWLCIVMVRCMCKFFFFWRWCTVVWIATFGLLA